MTVISLKKDDIQKNDLAPYEKYVSWHGNSKYFNMPAGQEHYKLLSHISSQLPKGSTVYDIGTYLGFSALALSTNPDVNVVTYDIASFVNPSSGFSEIHNIERRLGNCIADAKEIADKAKVIMIDVDPHDGVQEVDILTSFVENGFRGMILLDDIHVNECMQQFWEAISIPGTTKMDITDIGHMSGTGMIIWNDCGLEIVL